MSEHIWITTSDHVQIVEIFQNNGQKKSAILLHMMPATKESWKEFSEMLNRDGYATIAIDERGHGESTMNGTLDYHAFSEQQQKDKILDVEATFEFLKSKGFEEENIIVIGASIGANLGIQFLTLHPKVKNVVALSPGLNYRGVKTDEFITQLHDGQQVILVSSDDDDRDSAQSCRTLHELNSSQTILIEKNNLGHGTTMFENDPKLMDEVLGYLKL